MSRFEMRLIAYDVLDQVHVAISFREQDDALDHFQTWDSLVVTTIQGTGETDRRAWVQDALIAALERL